MCLNAHALALFLNMLNPDMISTDDGRITIASALRPAVWVRQSDHWCTMAPQIDQMIRFG